MDSLDFLEPCKSENAIATLIINVADGTVTTIDNLDLDIIRQRCPVLAFSFESRRDGKPKSWIDASSRTLIVCFLRFLYNGDYSIFNGNANEPNSLLIHAQLCQLGRIYEVPELQTMAHVYMIRDTEFSCSKPSPPVDLCEAIRFVYENLSHHKGMIDTILNYCASCFIYHRLATNETFRRVAYELRSFHKDLCRTNYKRKFKDDGAPDIVRLPVKEVPQTLNSILEMAALGDFPYDLWEDEGTKDPEQELQEKVTEELLSRFAHGMVYRLRPLPRMDDNVRSGDSEGSGSDTDGYTLVHRRKRDSAGLERSQDESNKRGRLSVGSSNALSNHSSTSPVAETGVSNRQPTSQPAPVASMPLYSGVSETQRLVWESEPPEWRSEEKRGHSSMDYSENAGPAPSSEPLQSSTPTVLHFSSDRGSLLHLPPAHHQAVEETTPDSDVEASVDAVTPGTESDDFEHIFAVGELELQDSSDSEWSVV